MSESRENRGKVGGRDFLGCTYVWVYMGVMVYIGRCADKVEMREILHVIATGVVCIFVI